MSSWLKPVNIPLENLDGKAEEEVVAADAQGLQTTIGACNLRVLQEVGWSNDGDEDHHDNDDHNDGDDSEVEDEDYVVDDGADEVIKELLSYNEPINMRLRLQDPASEDGSFHEEEKPAMKGSNHSSNKSNNTDASSQDTPPQAPFRRASSSLDLNSRKSNKDTTSQDFLKILHDLPSPTTTRPMDVSASGQMIKCSIKNPKHDESPRFPRRTVDYSTELPVAGPSILLDGEDEGFEFFNQPGETCEQQTTRYPSIASRVGETKQEPGVIVSSSNLFAGNRKASEEYQTMKDNIQALEVQLANTTTELKTSQTQVQSLTSQTRTLETKLEAAYSELHAQSEELRRAEERLEKDTLRAQEEREVLLHDHSEELEEVHQTHKRELDGLRTRYESRLA